MGTRKPPHISIDIHCRKAAEVIWGRLWNLDRHTAAVPFTTVLSEGESLERGARFIARTNLGPFTIDDRMVVRRWEPPRRATVEKVGPLLFGTIEAIIVEEAAGCRLMWEQTYAVRGVPRLLERIFEPAVERAYRSTLIQIIEEHPMKDSFEIRRQ